AGLPTHAVERRRQLRAPRSVNDGNGFVFVDHRGHICPSGVLPVQRGNVPTASLADVYRADEVFTRLRNANALLDKCGRCRFREICGGSRARAFAATGAVMASDPLCAYQPGPHVEPLATIVPVEAAERGAAVRRRRSGVVSDGGATALSQPDARDRARDGGTPRQTDRIIVSTILNRARAWTACG